ncbi:heme/hemin ABC transporter substrate-binding protein [Falsirhodobacter deserti]|uniref:heme/hemin ABC transporter substrate-binding protein n=1 Tax=Falsirhodobacter deserti TaxID=1365611 RepID=UPI000FE33B9B|nr:ABC transporter substrate-binding protein [Falsirhodobacter deserti]
MIRLAFLLACLAFPAAAQDRIVSLGGSVSEIVAALGAADRLVARDSTTLYPPELIDLPDVGYIRSLSPEGVLSVGPDIILAEDGAGPVEVVEALQQAGVPFVSIPEDPSPEGVLAKIRAVAAALDMPAQGEALAADVAEAFAAVPEPEGQPLRVLFVLAQQGGRLMVGGQGTAADGIIRLAGGMNAATGFSGYKPMTDEAIITAQPDAILMMTRGESHALSDADLLAHPALAVTPAAQIPVIRMDGLLLLGFGPRTPQAARDLHAAIYGG